MTCRRARTADYALMTKSEHAPRRGHRLATSALKRGDSFGGLAMSGSEA